MFSKLTSTLQHLFWNVAVIFLLSIRHCLRHYSCCLLKLKKIIAFVPIFSICFIELVFPFNFTFYIIIYPQGSLSSNVTSLFRVKFENIFINVSLKTYTCLSILLLLNITSQLTEFIDFLIPSTFASLQSQTKHPHGGEYSILRLSL